MKTLLLKLREALDFYMRLMRGKPTRRQLEKESKAVRGSSLAVLEELERFEDDLPEDPK